MELKLVIGNKNYSSWSMRVWMAMKCFDFEFDETRVALFSTGYKEALAAYSPSARVPVLIDGDIATYDSLAICEYLAELKPQMWPKKKADRATARSVAAEMHASFFHIRDQLPPNCRLKTKLPSISTAVQQEMGPLSLTNTFATCEKCSPLLVVRLLKSKGVWS